MNKHLAASDDESKKTFHSHGMAEAANADRIGAVGRTPFEQRIMAENNRSLIGGYNRSTLGAARSVLRASPVKPNTTGPRSNMTQRTSVRRPGTTGSRGFSEPSSRGFNPYA